MLSKIVDVDGVRVSDLSAFGWAGVVLIVVSVAWGLVELLTRLLLGGDLVEVVLLGGFVALLGSMMAWESASPECDATCEACGDRIYSNASRDDATEFVKVTASGAPRRVSIGPLSVVASTRTLHRTYCSGECAAEDSRVLLERHDHEVVSSSTEVDDAI